MSDSNVGARKQMSSINHISIVNGVIHETISSKNNKTVTFQIFDFSQMFDSMRLKQGISDLYNSGMQDDTLSLLYDSNKDIIVKVKTVAKHFEELVLQGDTWGPFMVSNQVYTFGKQILDEEPHYLYKYKGYVPISVLGMIDDVVGLSESGIKAKQFNAFVKVKAAEKGLQFGLDKCHTINIKRNNAHIVKSDLFIDHWNEKHNEEDHTIDTFEGKLKKKNVSEQKY